jgi:hypothetical protein
MEGSPVADLEFLWKDANSALGGCPALYRTPDGYVVQGKRLDDDQRAQLRDLGGDEDGVFVPTNVLERLRTTDGRVRHRPTGEPRTHPAG